MYYWTPTLVYCTFAWSVLVHCPPSFWGVPPPPPPPPPPGCRELVSTRWSMSGWEGWGRNWRMRQREKHYKCTLLQVYNAMACHQQQCAPVLQLVIYKCTRIHCMACVYITIADTNQAHQHRKTHSPLLLSLERTIFDGFAGAFGPSGTSDRQCCYHVGQQGGEIGLCKGNGNPYQCLLCQWTGRQKLLDQTLWWIPWWSKSLCDSDHAACQHHTLTEQIHLERHEWIPLILQWWWLALPTETW